MPAVNPRLLLLRNELLSLHKVLIDSERAVYEQTVAPIPSRGLFLQLLTGDPWFAWLHAISELIVVIDEATDGRDKDLLTEEASNELMHQIRRLLVPSGSEAEPATAFSQRYAAALQRDPSVVLSHAKIIDWLPPAPTVVEKPETATPIPHTAPPDAV